MSAGGSEIHHRLMFFLSFKSIMSKEISGMEAES